MILVRYVDRRPVQTLSGIRVHTFPANQPIPKDLFDRYFGKPKRKNLERQLRAAQPFERIVLQHPQDERRFLVVPMGPKGFTVHSV